MKVVLLEDVAGVGRAGEVCEVPAEYAAAFLFPKGMAAAATKDREQIAAETRGGTVTKSEEELAGFQQTVELVDGKTVLMKAPVGPTGQFGIPVTAADIEKEIETVLGTKLPPGTVRLWEPFREPGEQKLTLEFPHGLEAEITVVVEGVSTPPRAK